MTYALAPGNLAFVTVPNIIRELKEPTGPFPEEAIRDAQEQWEAVGPELLREFEDRAAAARDFAQSPDLLPFYAVFLFGQFRETRAFEPLIKMISLPGDLPFDLFHDAITENLKRVLGSVYNGNRSALESVVESDGVNDYVRSAALDTFIVLERSRQMTREEVLEYYRSLFHGRLKREPSFAWDALIGCIAELPAAELLPEARQAFADGLCDEWIAGIDWLEKRLAKPLESLLIEQEETYTLIDDALEELQSWFGFQPEPEAAFNPPKEIPALPGPEWTSTPNVPVVRTTPKVGRNDLCPCGSGKKYKKCCLAND